MKGLIVVPTYNERENVAELTRAALEQAPTYVDILIVDDNSPDGTGGIADQLARKNSRIRVLHRPGKQGLGKAYVAGFQWAFEQGYDLIVEMDCDFSHDPRYLPTMFDLLSRNDVVIGSRYVDGGGTRNWGLFRKIISRGGSFYARTILGAPINDFTGGFNGWHRRVLEGMGLETLRSDGYSFQIELKYRAYRLGYRIKEFPIVFEDRKVGHSKMSKRIVLEALKRVWEFRFRPAALPSAHIAGALDPKSKSS